MDDSANNSGLPKTGNQDIDADIALVFEIESIGSILDVVCQSTGMGFAAVARVTEDKWVATQVLDHVNFGLRPGTLLAVETTLGRQSRSEIVIEDVRDDVAYAAHHAPSIEGLQSYISVPIMLADGSFFGTLCAINAKPTKLRTGPAVGMFRLFAQMIARNIDDRRSIREGQRELAVSVESGALREEFIGVLGHDLKNPIAAIQGATRILTTEPQSPKSRAILALLRQTTDRMASLVGNLQDFTRGRLGDGLVLDLKEQVVSDLLDELIEEVRAVYPDRVIHALYGATAAVRIDRFRIAQLVVNLLGNAIVHGSATSPIGVDAVIAGGWLRLSVANAGLPIPEATRERLFEPFVKGDAGSKGLGLGLYIASQIAAAHGGTMSCYSDHDQTRFTFAMPA